jgi:hypothetical protein
MNCKSCLYDKKGYRPAYEGDCPESSGDDQDPDAPVGGKCPMNKPILKDGKCQLIYCTNEDYQKDICKIYNQVVKTQFILFKLFIFLNEFN